MQLGAVDCIHRGILNLRANWELIFVQWLQTTVVALLTLAGLFPLLAAFGLSGLASLASLFENGSAVTLEAAETLSRGGEAWLLLAVSLLVASAIWLMGALVYCYFLGGIFGVLMAGDRQAPAGERGQWKWFRTFNVRDLRGWAGLYLWRYFWLLNLFVLLLFAWITLPLLLALVTIWASSRWGISAAVGVGCGGAVPILFGLLLLAIWSSLAKADLARQDASVWTASRNALAILGRRFGAVLFISVVAFVVAMGVGVGLSVISLLADFSLGRFSLVRIGSEVALSLMQWLVSSLVALALAASLVGLVRSESSREATP